MDPNGGGHNPNGMPLTGDPSTWKKGDVNAKQKSALIQTMADKNWSQDGLTLKKHYVAAVWQKAVHWSRLDEQQRAAAVAGDGGQGAAEEEEEPEDVDPILLNDDGDRMLNYIAEIDDMDGLLLLDVHGNVDRLGLPLGKENKLRRLLASIRPPDDVEMNPMDDQKEGGDQKEADDQKEGIEEKQNDDAMGNNGMLGGDRFRIYTLDPPDMAIKVIFRMHVADIILRRCGATSVKVITHNVANNTRTAPFDAVRYYRNDAGVFPDCPVFAAFHCLTLLDAQKFVRCEALVYHETGRGGYHHLTGNVYRLQPSVQYEAMGEDGRIAQHDFIEEYVGVNWTVYLRQIGDLAACERLGIVGDAAFMPQLNIAQRRAYDALINMN